MKIRNDSEFESCPDKSDCFKVVFPVNLKLGDVFTDHGISCLSINSGRIYQMLRKVTKIELLKAHSNYLVISSILVGSAISKIIYDKVALKETRLVVVSYYDESHVNKKDCCFKDEEKPELFSTSTDKKPRHFIVDVSKLTSVRVPTEESSIYLGYF